MKNRYRGRCEVCGKDIPPKQGKWRLIPKQAQDFTGLRCKTCSTTTHKNRKEQKLKGIII